MEIEPYSVEVCGRRWWTRWDTTGDVLWLWTMVDGEFSDTLVPDDASDDALLD